MGEIKTPRKEKEQVVCDLIFRVTPYPYDVSKDLAKQILNALDAYELKEKPEALPINHSMGGVVMDETQRFVEIPIAMLHRIDSLLTLGVHRGVDDIWKKDSKELTGRIRELIKEHNR